MASPFKIFRKHQKVLIATLGLLAMIAFVFLPIVLQQMGLRSTANPVVVKTAKYGDIRQYELGAMRQRRQRVISVLEQLQAAVLAAGGTAEELQGIKSQIGPATEQAVVDTWLLARHAEQLGMVVSNRAINALFSFTERQFFQVFREELLALRLRGMFSVSLIGTPPAQRWEYFNRLKRMATIEVIPVSVGRYANEVPDPDEGTLRAFFEEHKDSYAHPASPEPGFRQPQKIAIRYFKAEYEKFMGSDAVTEDEIKRHYEKEKEFYDQLDSAAEEQPAEKEESGEEGKPAKEDVPAEEEKEEADEQPEKQEDDADDQPAEDEPAGEPVNAEEDPVAEPPHKDDESQNDEQEEKAREPEDLPSERVKELIRSRLAKQKGEQKIKKAFAGLQEKMSRYRNKWIKYEVDRLQNPKATPPTELDFDALAKGNGLGTGQTPLISQLEARNLDIGASDIDGRLPFVYYAYEALPKYRPATSSDIQGNHYLFWKVEETKDRIPKFEEEGVRQEVLRAWKMVQARKDATNEAQRLAEKARKADRSLKETFANLPDIQVTLTAPFSWMTEGNVPRGSSRTLPRLSEPDGVEIPGPDFMRTVFRLKEGGIGVAMNHPKTIAYVIRIAEVKPSEKVLWPQFEVDDYGKYAAVGFGEQREMIRAWQKELKSAAGLTWQRKADRRLGTRD